MTDDDAQTDQHLEIFSILSFVIAGLGGLVVLGLIGFMGFFPAVGRMGRTEMLILVAAIVPLLGMLALYIATGVGLRDRRPWARTTGLIASALSLLSFPLGTAYGVYGIWVLTRPETKAQLSPAPGEPAR